MSDQFITSGDNKIFIDYVKFNSSYTIVYVGGHKTVVEGGRKSEPIKNYCIQKEQSFLRFDYVGWGKSGDEHQEWDVQTWLQNLLDVIDHVDGNVVLAGNSMGGYLMLFAQMARPNKVVGLFGIASGFGEYIQDAGKNTMSVPDIDQTVHFDLLNDAHVITKNLPIHCPVSLIHGAQDDLVPVETAHNIMDVVQTNDCCLNIVKDGEHSMARDQDLEIIISQPDTFLNKF